MFATDAHRARAFRSNIRAREATGFKRSPRRNADGNFIGPWRRSPNTRGYQVSVFLDFNIANGTFAPISTPTLKIAVIKRSLNIGMVDGDVIHDCYLYLKCGNF